MFFSSFRTHESYKTFAYLFAVKMHLQTFKNILPNVFKIFCLRLQLHLLLLRAYLQHGNSHATPTQINSNNKGDITEFNCERFAKIRRTKANKFLDLFGVEGIT